jgi:ABC-type transporter MlaC component
MPKRIFVFLPVIVLALLHVIASPAAASSDVMSFFDSTQRQFVQVARTSAASRQQTCLRLVAQVFEVGTVARAVGTQTWGAMSSALRQQMMEAIATRLAKECVKLAERGNPALARVERIRERADGVRMTVIAPDEQGVERVVVWTLRRGARRGWVAVDLTFEGRDAVATFRQEFENALAARQSRVSEAVRDFSQMGN